MASSEYKAVVALGDGFEHFFFLRKSGERDVFIVNVYAGPPQCRAEPAAIEACLRETFEATCGEIERVELLGSQRTVGSRVTFKFAKGADAALALKKKLKLGPLAPKKFESCGACLAKHLADCENARDHELKANEILAAFEKDKLLELEQRNRLREAGPDDDGFVTVTYKRKAVNEAPRASEAAKKKVKRTTGAEPHEDFYHFQKRAKKTERLTSLRAAVHKEKDRIAKVAANRSAKFRPGTKYD